jgi:AP-1 complex subunit beta-1
MEKLEIMIMLVNERTIEQVLMELKEYATEVDVEFVRKAVRAIGRCAIKLDRAAEKCIKVLLELIQTKVNYVVQEAIIVIKDIFRKYPNRYESIISTLCENLDTLDDPEAKASMIWIIGEYAGTWRVACGVWRVACGVWRVACGVWRVACGVWRVACVANRRV